MLIIGAGLAGLMAGNLIPESRVIEQSPSPSPHRAVLRFRSPAVGDALGIPFKEVTVRKGIWDGVIFVRPNIQLANNYSRKVANYFADRSIWNIDTCQRWVAPEDFQQRMIKSLGDRITFGEKFTFTSAHQTISTIPMPALAAMFRKAGFPAFKYEGIYVERYRVRNANVHQTIYFPDPSLDVYRASVTGDLLSIEYALTELPDPKLEAEFNSELTEDRMQVREAFGLDADDLEKHDAGVQKYGKLIPIDDAWRRHFIADITQKYKVYSLGRFATWRNILLDDVLHDIAVIKKLISTDSYGQSLIRTEN